MNVNYPSPILVNGFSCNNCADVDLARKNIDPAHPKSGPGGINARSDPTMRPTPGGPPPDNADGTSPQPAWRASAQASAALRGGVDMLA